MKATVTLLETNLEVEYDFNITTGGCSSNGWDEPGWAAEFDIEVLGISFSGKSSHPSAPDIELQLPKWLSDLLATHLSAREDINTIVQQADQDRGSDYDDEC